LIPGDIVATNGRVIGEHRGLADYTIGQRKGLQVPSPVPLYVLRKDVAENRLIVGVKDELGVSALTAACVNWISGEPIREPFRAQVKTRYTAKEAAAEVAPIDDGRRVHVAFDAPQRDITPGQAAVFYQGECVVGGGIIQ
jgi:tRNA-specific 2-thiouridylase